MNVEIWDRGRAVPFLGIYKSKFLCSAGFLTVGFYVAPPTPATLPLHAVGKLSLFLSLPVCRRSTLMAGEGGGGAGRGAKSYDS
jgi:hypothetical protein